MSHDGFDSARRAWKFGVNVLATKNPDDLSVAANWPVLDAGDKVYSASTAVVGPAGVNDTSINTIAGDSTSGQHGLAPVVGLTAETHEFVVYARYGNKFLYLADYTVSNATAYFNLQTGVLGTVGAGCTASIKFVGNGWYRCAIRFIGTSAAHTFHISPTDADASTTMTGGDASTVNVYLWHPGVYAVRPVLHPDNKEGQSLRSTDDGDLLIGGFGEDGRPLPINVSKANATRSTADRVLLVQNVTATGAVLSGIETVSAADGATAATKSVLVGGKDGSGNQQDILVGTDGRIDYNQGQIAGHTISHNEGTLDDGCQRVSLATDDDLVAAFLAYDNFVAAPGSAAPSSAATVGGSDGTNLRILKTDSAGVVYSQPAVVPTYEDTTNGWAKTRDTSHYSACSADVATVTVDGTTEGTADEIIPSTNVSTYRGFTLWIENLGATALNHVYVYASRDGTNWACVDSIKNALEIACDSLAATSNGICFSVTTNPGWQYVKCAATVAAGSTTATGALSYQM